MGSDTQFWGFLLNYCKDCTYRGTMGAMADGDGLQSVVTGITTYGNTTLLLLSMGIDNA